MRALIFLVALPAFGLVDSHKEFPSKLPRWKLTAHHMDTGEIRGCSAVGSFGGLNVILERPSGSSPKLAITFRYSKDNLSDRQTRTDERACGSGKPDAPAGTWRYNPQASADEICDGMNWRTLTEGHFRNAGLLLNGKVIAESEEGADYKVDFNGDKPVVYKYSAWFHDAAGLEEKLLHAGSVAIQLDEPKLKPIELRGLNLDKVQAQLRSCTAGKK